MTTSGFTTGPTIPWDSPEFAAIRSCTATAVRHGQNMLDVLIQAADLNPWTPPSAT